MSDSPEEFNSIAYRDILMNMILGLLAIIGMVFLMFSFQKVVSAQQKNPPGNLMITISWPTGSSDDVDLWVYGGNEKLPVGFSNKSGILFDLLRDDLGSKNDDTDLNYEAAFSHGIVAGDYVFNVYCYTCKEVPVMVHWEVTLSHTGGTDGVAGTPTQVASGTVTLFREKQEITLVSFKMNGSGEVDQSSVSHLFQPLAISEEFKKARGINDQ